MPPEFVVASLDRQGPSFDCREIPLVLLDTFPFYFWRGMWHRNVIGGGRDVGVLSIARKTL